MALTALIAVFIIIGLTLLNKNNICEFLKHRSMMARLPVFEITAYPVIGHSYILAGTPVEFFRTSINLASKFYEKTKQKISILWLGPVPLIIILHPEAAEVILKSSKHTTKSFLYHFLHPWLGTGLLTSHGEKWKQRRRLITPSFHFNILKDFLEVMNEQSSIFIRNLRSKVKSDQSVDVGRAITLCALDIICETVMGQTVNAQDDTDSNYIKALNRISDLIQLRQKTPYMWWDFTFKKMKVGKEHDRLLKTLHGFTFNVIQERMNSKDLKHATRRMAFLDTLLHAKTVDGQQLTLTDIQEEVDTFMFEGHETTAAAMTWATYLIGRHPDVQKTIHKELQTIFGSDKERVITMEDIQKLQYLEKVIKESLRLFPPVPLIARVTTEECNIDGFEIPKGTQVAIFASYIHQNLDIWENSKVFDPERFSPEKSSKRYPYDYIPFSAGPRNCIGQRFALLEEKVMLAHLLRNFYVTSHDERESIEMVGDLILRPAKSLNITLSEKL